MEKGCEEMTELPQRLKDAQEEIAAIHRADALQALIGKFYSKHEGLGYPTRLRRIFLDDNQEVTVEDYHSPHGSHDFHYTSYKITEAATMQNNYGYSELEGKVFYDILDMFLNSKPINSLVVTRQGKVIETLKTSVREHEKTQSRITDEKWKLQETFDNLKNAFSTFEYTHDEKQLLEVIKRNLKIE